jgi:hypothetical protein
MRFSKGRKQGAAQSNQARFGAQIFAGSARPVSVWQVNGRNGFAEVSGDLGDDAARVARFVNATSLLGGVVAPVGIEVAVFM